MKPKLIHKNNIIILLAFIIIFSGLTILENKCNNKTNNIRKMESHITLKHKKISKPIVTNVVDIEKDYINNINMKDKYQDNTITITGIIDSKGEVFGKDYILFKKSHYNFGIQVIFDDEINVKIGNEITIKGVVSDANDYMCINNAKITD